MNRVLAARALQFSEHRGKERKDAGKTEVAVLKKADGKESTGKNRSTFAASGGAHEKLKIPTIVASIVQKNAVKKCMEPHGVWSPLGFPYETHGVPDLHLGDDANVYESKKAKKQRKVSTEEHNESRQKLELLLQKFRTTKESLQAVNLFNRPGSQAKSSGLLPSVAEQEAPGSRDSTPRGDKKDRLHRDKELSTLNKIAMLGTEVPRATKAKKEREAQKYKRWDHLDESRAEHMSRWRDAFEEAKDSKDRDLIQRLVARAEDRERVYDSPKLLNNAVGILSRVPPQRLQLSADKLNIWEKSKLQEFNRRKHELELPHKDQHHATHHQKQLHSSASHANLTYDQSESTHMLVDRLRSLHSNNSPILQLGLNKRGGGGAILGRPQQSNSKRPQRIPHKTPSRLAHSVSAPMLAAGR